MGRRQTDDDVEEETSETVRNVRVLSFCLSFIHLIFRYLVRLVFYFMIVGCYFNLMKSYSRKFAE